MINYRIELAFAYNFNLLAEDTPKIKYPAEQKTTIVYTNEIVTINISLNHTQSKTNRDYIPACKYNFVRTFKKTHPATE